MGWRDNPLLWRELFYRLRFQPSRRSLLLLVVVLFLIAVALFYWTALQKFQSVDRYRDLLTLTLVIEMLLVVVSSPAATVNAISKEREQRTWNLLVITLLTPQEIVLGKLLGRMLPLLLILVLGLPMLGLCIIGDPRLWLSALLGDLCVLVTLVLYGVGGLAASCFSHKTVTATVMAYLFVGGWVFGPLVLWGLTSLLAPTLSTQEVTFWLSVEPFAVLEPVVTKFSPQRYSSSHQVALYVLSPWVLLVVYSGLTVVLVWTLISTYRYWAYR